MTVSLNDLNLEYGNRDGAPIFRILGRLSAPESPLHQLKTMSDWFHVNEERIAIMPNPGTSDEFIVGLSYLFGEAEGVYVARRI